MWISLVQKNCLRASLALCVFFSLGVLAEDVDFNSADLDASVTEDYKQVKEQKLFNGETVYEYRLKNKLTVLLVPRHQAEVLTYQIWFRVGSIDEKQDPKLNKTGLAHLFEHMMFRGTQKYPDGKFDELASRIGATEQNATTYFYRTNYFESIPSNQLETLMELEADRMENLRITKDLFEKEKGAVVGELRRALDNPVRAGFDALQILMFPKENAYRYTVLGSEKEITGFTLDEANYFYKTFYAPNNATLILVGDFQVEAAMKLIVKYHGHMKPQALPPRKSIPNIPQSASRMAREPHSQSTSETALIAFQGPPIESPDMVPLALLATHLSSGREARLKKLLVDTGIAVSAGGSPGNQPDIFDFVISMAEGHTAEEGIRIFDSEIENIVKNGIPEPDFKRALNQELLDLYQGIESNSQLARTFGEYLMLSGDYLRGFQIIEGFKKLTPKDLQDIAAKYFQKQKQNIIIVQPKKAVG